MKRFYVDLLGFAVEWEPDPDNVYLSSGIDNLALHRAASVSEVASPLDHLGVIVRSPDDVDRWAAFLEGRGVTIDARGGTADLVEALLRVLADALEQAVAARSRRALRIEGADQ